MLSVVTMMDVTTVKVSLILGIISNAYAKVIKEIRLKILLHVSSVLEFSVIRLV